MWPVSDKFMRHLTGDHQVFTRVTGLSPDPDVEPIDLTPYFASGSLTVARQEIRRTGTITLTDHDGSLLPIAADSPIAPYGQELFIEHGLVYPDGTEELVPQGIFRITKPRARGTGEIELELADRAWVAKRARLEKPLTIAKNTIYTDAILQLLALSFPKPLEIEVVTSDADLTPTIILEDQADPWAEAQKMAEAIGYLLYFDRVGRCQLFPEPDYEDVEPVWSYNDALVEMHLRTDESWFNLSTSGLEIEWDTEATFNAVIVTGENTDNSEAFRGAAYDLDPASPTNYDGPFGRVPMFHQNPLVTSNAMATKSAATLLKKQLGISEGVTIPAIAHPALDLDDPTDVVRTNLGIDQVHLVDGHDLPLRAGMQTVATRARRVVLGD